MAAPPKKTPFAAALDIRYVGSIPGRYTFPDTEERTVYSCRTSSLSPSIIVLEAPVSSTLGERVAMRLDHVGLLNGTIAQVMKGGFHVNLLVEDADRHRLAAKINWLKKRSLRQADDKRSGARFMPRNPRGFMQVDGAEHECFIVDLSVSGAALSARLVPPPGTPVVIGTVAAKVVRHFEGGFSVRFDEPRTAASVEAEITAPRAPAGDAT